MTGGKRPPAVRDAPEAIPTHHGGALQGRQIVYIANDWVRENKTSAHHIAETLARRNRVLYIEGGGMRKPRLAKRDLAKAVRKLKTAIKRPEKRDHGIYFYSPLLLPFHKSALVREVNRQVLAAMVRSACRFVGFENPIIWNYMPHYAPVLRSLRHEALVYYCTDEYSAYPNVDADAIRRMEALILEQAQVVFVASDALYDSKKPLNPHTFLSPHGVDLEHFRGAMAATTAIPADIGSIERPIAGFFGLIEEWIDLDLIAFLARSMPRVSFVLIGHSAVDVSMLHPLRNVHLLGRRPYAALPGYLRAFDVCMLPYRPTPQVINANPKKLREYLAAGKPVVSVPNREVEKFGDLLYLAADYAEFRDCIDRALRHDPEDAPTRRLDAMSLESWESRVERMCDIIEQRIEETTSARAR